MRTAGALFVAHNARFDYAFLKHAFARLQRKFSARVLCTVRLSRRLFPDEPRHSLDSVIARHGLAVDGRHRALGDARALWAFVQTLYRDLSPDAMHIVDWIVVGAYLIWIIWTGVRMAHSTGELDGYLLSDRKSVV